MARPRKSRQMHEQIFKLHKDGLGPRAIARALNVSRNTVRAVLRRGEDGARERARPTWADGVDWAVVAREHGMGATLKSLWRERVPHIDYAAFWREFRAQFPATPEVTIRLAHKPGERSFFDFCDGIDLVDPTSGQVIKTQLLVGVLPFSSLTLGEFTLDQKQATLVRAMENIFRRLGGVTPYATLDNLKPAVTRAHIYDPEANRSFTEFADHMGFALLPARPARPRDKAAVEAAIGVVQRQFFSESRNQTFHTLSQLNQVFFAYLDRLNREPMKDHADVSRIDRAACERELLKPLPRDPFALSEWRTCKVHADCHIQVERRFYSVPFAFVGQTVRVRLRAETIEVFCSSGEALALHPRLKGNMRISTQEAHYPEAKQAAARFEVRHALRDAERIGPKTHQLISKLLEGPQPLRLLRRAQGILRLKHSGQVSAQALEHAAERAMLFNKTQYAFVKSAALHFQANGKVNAAVVRPPARDINHVYLHNQPPRPKEDQ